jgi:hypothetical protein
MDIEEIIKSNRVLAFLEMNARTKLKSKSTNEACQACQTHSVRTVRNQTHIVHVHPTQSNPIPNPKLESWVLALWRGSPKPHGTMLEEGEVMKSIMLL